MVDYAVMKRHTEDFMSLWRSRKPTIAKVQGYAVAGGSDIALCCDLLVMADDAKIGYMPTRVWGCPTTAMWTFRLGPARAKQLMFTGDLITGAQAAEWGLANIAVPAAELDAATDSLARRIAGVPRSHLAMHKLVVNQVMLTAGLEQAQTLATVFDGVTRHNPEGVWFRRRRSSTASRRRSSGATAAGRSRKATRPARSSPSSSGAWRRQESPLRRGDAPTRRCVRRSRSPRAQRSERSLARITFAMGDGVRPRSVTIPVADDIGRQAVHRQLPQGTAGHLRLHRHRWHGEHDIRFERGSLQHVDVVAFEGQARRCGRRAVEHPGEQPDRALRQPTRCDAVRPHLLQGQLSPAAQRMRLADVERRRLAPQRLDDQPRCRAAAPRRRRR